MRKTSSQVARPREVAPAIHAWEYNWPGRLLLVVAMVAWTAGAALPTATAQARTPISPAAPHEQHWSLKPVNRPPVPAAKTGARNEIDHFIFARLAEHSLTASPEADRPTLIRRLYFDVLGLPPSPEEVQSFARDTTPAAYERLVERLLASPRYGEHWARHWLDVVRFAETHGFEMNNPRPNAWPYRDYVIGAFNEDKPYDQFIVEQIAGDVSGVDAATGFLVAGAWDQVKSPDPVLTANQRADELHDLVSTTGSAFLGLTVGCARCHDHKFDPIPQTEYYALKACLDGVHHGERKLRSATTDQREQEIAQCRRQLQQVEADLAELEPLALVGEKAPEPRRSAVNAQRNVEHFSPVNAKRLRFTVARTTDAEPCLDELEVFSAGSSSNIALASLGTKARASSVYPNSDLHRVEHINDGKLGNSHSWISNERGQGWIELEFPREVVIDRVAWGRDREQVYQDRLALEYRIEVAGASNDFCLVASSQDREAYRPGKTGQSEPVVARSGEENRSRTAELTAQAAHWEGRLKELTSVPMVYAGTFDAEPEPVHRLNRGDPMQEREVVEPGAIRAIAVPFQLEGINPDSGPEQVSLTPDQRRRLTLAKWLANPTNPLPARVMVNRLWLYHFGEGLVSTPSDFGVNGVRPSHPELLDWLAAEFIHPSVCTEAEPHPTPWSIKHLQRLILNSATYRQASSGKADGLSADAATRLLWRFPPRRIEAESLRDAILSVSGCLDLRMGGPGFSVFEPNDNYVRVYEPKKDFGPAEWRRMIYMTKVRMQQDATFGAFDCPDAGQITPKRMRSTTPLQALNLLNSAFMLRQASLFALKLEKQAGPEPAAKVRLAFALAFGRFPEAEETRSAERLISQGSLALFCRALFNANEFLFLD